MYPYPYNKSRNRDNSSASHSSQQSHLVSVSQGISDALNTELKLPMADDIGLDFDLPPDYPAGQPKRFGVVTSSMFTSDDLGPPSLISSSSSSSSQQSIRTEKRKKAAALLHKYEKLLQEPFSNSLRVDTNTNDFNRTSPPYIQLEQDICHTGLAAMNLSFNGPPPFLPGSYLEHNPNFTSSDHPSSYRPGTGEDEDDLSLGGNSLEVLPEQDSLCTDLAEMSSGANYLALFPRNQDDVIFQVASDSSSGIRSRSQSQSISDTDSETESRFEASCEEYASLIYLRDILQDDFQRNLELQESHLSQDLSLIKDYLTNYNLKIFWSCSDYKWAPDQNTYTGTPSQSSGSSSKAGSPGKSSQSSTHGGKRKRQDVDSENNCQDEPRSSNQGVVRGKARKDKSLHFACPFRKYNPARYNLTWPCCSLTSYENVSRLKEHMIRGPHRAWECDRCRTSFKTEKEKINHNREETACRLVTEAHIEAEGIHQHHVEWLRAKGKSYTEAAGKRYSQQTEEERWITIYKELFSCSDDAVPNPYFEEPTEGSTSRSIEDFSRFLLDELPGEFQREASSFFSEETINQFSNILERCTPNIITRFNQSHTSSIISSEELSPNFEVISNYQGPSQLPADTNIPSPVITTHIGDLNLRPITPPGAGNTTIRKESDVSFNMNFGMSTSTHGTYASEDNNFGDNSWHNFDIGLDIYFDTDQNKGLGGDWAASCDFGEL